MSAELARPLRFLVLDAYAREGRAALAAAGGTPAGTLYRRMLLGLAPGSVVDVGEPADGDVLPHGVALGDYDGITWTGSSLTIHDAGDLRVRRQLELARAAYRLGVPSFGSCWAAQLSVAAAGGRCAASARGREFGVARRITLSQAGRAHPLYQGKPAEFDALTSHADEVCELPEGAQLLASNEWSRVQAVAVSHGAASFWAVQYHPEYDLAEVAALARLRREELVAQGEFADAPSADAWIADLDALHADPARRDLVERLGLGPGVCDAALRTLEVRNWIERAVRPGADR